MSDDLVRTGIAGLDEILEGGFVRGSSVLIEGPPGGGKTNLGLQILWNGITRFNEPALMVSFEQFPEQLLRDAAAFGWDFRTPGQEGMFRLIGATPQQMLETITGEGTDTDRLIDICSEEIRPKRILIDSLTHFRRISQDESRLREIVIKFIHGLAKRGYTSFLTREVQGPDGPIAFEEYAVDASIRLHNEPLSGVGGNKRSIEVRKTRGHVHVSGKHPMFFEPDGLAIYPHRKPKPSGPPDPSQLKASRLVSGVDGLDDLLHGGYVDGSCVLLAGAAGSGKTTIGLQFLRAGLEQGEPGVLATFNESPQRIAQRFSLMGVDVERALADRTLTILATVPIELCIEKLRHDLGRIVKETGAKRLVIDGISDFETSVRDPKLLRDYLTWLVKEFDQWGVTALLTSEIEQVTGATRVSDIGCAFLMDAVLYLGFAEIDSVMRRVMAVLKMRNSEHESDLRELLLSPTSACIGDTFAGMSGVMGGTPSGKYHQTVEKVMQPLSFIRGFMTQLIEGEVDPERQKKLLSMMKTQTEKVIAFLCEYYDLDFDKMTGKQE